MFTKRSNNKADYLYYIGTLIIACVLLVQCKDNSSTNSDPDTYKLSGTVTNVTGEPVFEADVNLMDGGNEVASATANQEGQFELTEIPPGSYDIVINGSGYNELKSSVTVEEDISQEFELLGDATITGTVVDWQNGDGLAEASIQFSAGATVSEADTSKPDLVTTVDGSDGSFTLENAPTGSYVAVINLDGYVPQILEGLNLEDGTNELGETIVSKAYSYTGQVITSTEDPVSEAEITVSGGFDNSVSTSTTTDSVGKYTITGIPGGDYDVTITGEGYNDITSTVTIDGDDTELVFELLGDANISGRVLDSQSGSGLADAHVEFSRGATIAEADTAGPEFTTVTDANGSYSIVNAAIGSYVCVIYADGYEPQVVEDVDFSEGDNDLGESTAVEEVEEGEVRIVLTWGETPDDLDTHLTGPISDNSSDRFHVYFSDKNPVQEVELDVDDITSYGPETTTIREVYNGTYRYSVHNYSNQSETGAQGIKESPAQVEVYDSSGQIATFTPPAATETSGDTWRVFEMNVDDEGISLDELATYDNITDVSDGSQFRIAGDYKRNVSFSKDDF